MYPQQSDTAILDNLLRMTKRSSFPWLIFDLFNIRKLIFYVEQIYYVLSQRLDGFGALKILPNVLLLCLLQCCLTIFCFFFSLSSPFVRFASCEKLTDSACFCMNICSSLGHLYSLFALHVRLSVLWCHPTISDPFLKYTANFSPSPHVVSIPPSALFILPLL